MGDSNSHFGGAVGNTSRGWAAVERRGGEAVVYVGRIFHLRAMCGSNYRQNENCWVGDVVLAGGPRRPPIRACRSAVCRRRTGSIAAVVPAACSHATMFSFREAPFSTAAYPRSPGAAVIQAGSTRGSTPSSSGEIRRCTPRSSTPAIAARGTSRSFSMSHLCWLLRTSVSESRFSCVFSYWLW